MYLVSSTVSILWCILWPTHWGLFFLIVIILSLHSLQTLKGGSMFLFYFILLFYFTSFCKAFFFFHWRVYIYVMDICLTVVAKLCFFNVFQYVDQVNCKKEKANSCTESPTTWFDREFKELCMRFFFKSLRDCSFHWHYLRITSHAKLCEIKLKSASSVVKEILVTETGLFSGCRVFESFETQKKKKKKSVCQQTGTHIIMWKEPGVQGS